MMAWKLPKNILPFATCQDVALISPYGVQCHAKGGEISSLQTLETNSILAIKGGHVFELNGRTVGTIPTTWLFINPNIAETR